MTDPLQFFFLFNPFTSLPRDVDSFNYWRSSLNPIGKENLRMNGANKIVHFVYDGLDENMRGQSFFLSLSLSFFHSRKNEIKQFLV
jgi:hypothetical protein